MTVAAVFVAACGGGGGDAGSGAAAPPGPLSWGAVQTLATNAVDATAPAVAIDGNGLASVLWSQIGLPLPGGGTSAVPLIGAAGSGSGAAFGPVQAIETSAAFSAADVVDALGTGGGQGNTAVWLRRLASNNAVQIGSAAREGAAWTSQLVATRPAGAMVRELTHAANAAGARVAVWTEADVAAGGTRRVRLSARTASSGWTPPVAISGTAADASAPAVAVDAHGLAMIVWRQGVAPGLLRARSYDTGTGQLGNELEVDPGQFTNDMRNPHVVALAPGSFLATWEQAGQGGAYDLRANTGSASGWQHVPATLEFEAGSVDRSLVVAGPGASAFAVWRQNDAVVFSRYAAGIWSVARRVNGGQTGASRDPRVAVDGGGNAIFVWVQTPAGGGVDDLFYATFTASNGELSGAFQLDTEANGQVASPALSVAAGGAAVVAWLQHVAGQPDPNVVARVLRP